MRSLALKISVFLFIVLQFSVQVTAQNKFPRIFTRSDSLRGSYGEYRQKWNLLHYDLTVEPDYTTKTIRGVNKMTFTDSGISKMQIDFQVPMELDSITEGPAVIRYRREGNVYWITVPSKEQNTPSERAFVFYFHGQPREALQPPWDGGWIWKKDSTGSPLMTTATQGLGASVWFPCKDSQADEPDSGAVLRISVPDSLVAVGNGRLISKEKQDGNKILFSWRVTAPINNYCITPYIGKYVHFAEKYKGEKGTLDLDYWVLPYNLAKAQHQFKDATRMMKALEYWFGPYPFYTDGFKIVEVPMLGMEHQSAIAYGNRYENGYNNSLRTKHSWSDSKWEQMFDYIIIHEGGHEWFGNNITSKDIADMWLHESFTTYGEVLFIEQTFGKEAAREYLYGTRKNFENQQPIIGPYNVNADGDLDLYFKGSNFLHTLRQIIDDDRKFRGILRGINKDYYHQTVTSAEIEKYMIKQSGKKLEKVFDQYLRTKDIPVFAFRVEGKRLFYRWENVVNGFDMPVKINLGPGGAKKIYPTPGWKNIVIRKPFKVEIDKSFLVNMIDANDK